MALNFTQSSLPAANTQNTNCFRFSQLNEELGRPCTQAIDINDTSVREFTDQSSGSVHVCYFYGKTNWCDVTCTFQCNQNKYCCIYGNSYACNCSGCPQQSYCCTVSRQDQYVSLDAVPLCFYMHCITCSYCACIEGVVAMTPTPATTTPTFLYSCNAKLPMLINCHTISCGGVLRTNLCLTHNDRLVVCDCYYGYYKSYTCAQTDGYIQYGSLDVRIRNGAWKPCSSVDTTGYYGHPNLSTDLKGFWYDPNGSANTIGSIAICGAQVIGSTIDTTALCFNPVHGCTACVHNSGYCVYQRPSFYGGGGGRSCFAINFSCPYDVTCAVRRYT